MTPSWCCLFISLSYFSKWTCKAGSSTIFELFFLDVEGISSPKKIVSDEVEGLSKKLCPLSFSSSNLSLSKWTALPFLMVFDSAGEKNYNNFEYFFFALVLLLIIIFIKLISHFFYLKKKTNQTIIYLYTLLLTPPFSFSVQISLHLLFFRGCFPYKSDKLEIMSKIRKK